MGLQEKMEEIAKSAHELSFGLSSLKAQKKNEVLGTMAELLVARSAEILSANEKDIAIARKRGSASSIIDRLTLNPKRITLMADGLKIIRELNDPAGEVIEKKRRPNGLQIKKVRVPIGVIYIIYEARPNVTVDSAGLCFKSGNCVILRGGGDAINSNTVLSRILGDALLRHNLDSRYIQFIETPDRRAVSFLLKMPQFIDLVIPRGGESLIKTVVNESKIPVIKHYKGICHVYVDRDTDIGMAERIVINAKTQMPAVCNAMETLLVHKDIAKDFLPLIACKLIKDHKVELRGCPLSQKLAPGILPAKERDWRTEYLDLILSVKVVQSLDEAISHINHYGSKHSDSIVTKNRESARRFTEEVDSACVFVNASTRFSDGGEFGMGAEIGISTDKIHARGPMGLCELTTYKYIVTGNGQVRL